MPSLSILKNNVSTTVGPTGYVAGSGSLTLAPGGGSAFPSLSAGQYLRVTVIQAAFARVPSASPSTFTIFKVTAVAGDVLTIGGTFEGTLDRSYTAGDVVEMRLTAGLIEEIQAAVASEFGASGPGHASGLVPDPGSVAGTIRYLREDATFQDPLVGAAGRNLFDFLSPLVNNPISITGTTTLTYGTMNVCSGTSAYNVTLPAPAAGKMLGIRMAPLGASAGQLNKLITVLPSSTEKIDGASSRVMWAGEFALLYTDGTNWFKLFGRAIPMSCVMGRNGALTIAGDGVVHAIPLDATTSDPTGLMADAVSNNRINIVRAGNYQAFALIYLAMGGSGSTTYVIGCVLRNGANLFLGLHNAAGAGSAQPVLLSGGVGCSVNDYFGLTAQQGSGQAASVVTGGGGTYLMVQEIPGW
jgi:hypothetical protein